MLSKKQLLTFWTPFANCFTAILSNNSYLKLTFAIMMSLDEEPEIDFDNQLVSHGNSENETEASSVPNFESSNPDVDEDYEFEVLVQAYMRDAHYSSQQGSLVKIFHAILNASVVVLPFAACHAGLPLYMGLIMFMALCSAYSSVLIVRMASDQKIRTFEGLAEYAFGPIGFFVVCGCQLLFSMTLMCISLDVWADVIDSVSTEVMTRTASNALLYDVLTSRNSVVILGGLLVFPFCLFTKSMVSLAWSSYLTILAVVVGLVAVIGSFYVGNYTHTSTGGEDERYDSVLTVKPNWWIAVFVVTLCFSYNQKAFVVYNCLRHRSPKRWRWSVKWAHALMAGIYLLLGNFGYLSDVDALNESTGGGQCRNRFDYFSTYHEHADKTLFHVARCVVAASLLMAFPVDSLVAVTTLTRVQRRYDRFLRSLRSGEYGSGASHAAGSHGGSGDQNAGVGSPSRFNSPMKSGDVRSPQAGGADPDNRETLLFNLLEMPNRNHPGRSESVLSRISTVLMPCFFTRRSSRSRGSSGPRMSDGSQAAGSLESHVYSSVPTDIEGAEAEEGEGQHSGGSGGSAGAVGRFPSMGSEHRSASQCSLPADLSPEQPGVEEETDDLTYIQSQIQTEQTINQIRGSTSRSNLSSITSSRSPSLAVSRTNTLTLPVSDMEVTVLEDEVERGDSVRQSLTSSGGVRRSSLAAVLQRPRNFPDLIKDMVPSAIIWTVCVTGCLLIERWVLFAGMIGMLCTSILVFLLPSMIYFRVGVFADYQAAPILCGTTIPNRLYMFWMQIFGLIGMISVLGLLATSIVWPSMYSYGYSDDF